MSSRIMSGLRSMLLNVTVALLHAADEPQHVKPLRHRATNIRPVPPLRQTVDASPAARLRDDTETWTRDDLQLHQTIPQNERTRFVRDAAARELPAREVEHPRHAARRKAPRRSAHLRKARAFHLAGVFRSGIGHETAQESVEFPARRHSDEGRR